MDTLSSSLLLPIPLFILLFTFNHAAGDDRISINCGSSSPSASIGGTKWLPDVQSMFSSSTVTVKGVSSRTSSNKQPTVDPVPYSTARVSDSQFSYSFRLNTGQKYIRLHFSPNSYKFKSLFSKKKLEDCFSVEVGPFTLLANFSASVTARALGRNVVTKEFCIDIRDSMDFSLVFTPSVAANPLQGFYAFVNGIEIISAPSSRSYCIDRDVGAQIVGQKSVLYIDSSTALEIVYRLDVKRDFVPSAAGDDDYGLFRIREQTKGVRHNTWKVSVDVGFRYLIMLHFCEIGLHMIKNSSRDFMILINGANAVSNADLSKGRNHKGILWYKNYMVTLYGNKHAGKRDILISLQSKDELMDRYGPLEGFEIFKLSNPDNSLASPDPLPPAGDSLSSNTQSFLAALGSKNVLAAVVVMLICSVNVIVHKLQHGCEVNLPEEESTPLTKSIGVCRQFTLSEIRLATYDFFDALVIGKGGFGKVYMGHIDNGKQTVAIKRLKPNSSQGMREFQTEVELLSKVRHVNVVSLVGYCSEKREMIIVYEYVPGKSLANHLHMLSMKSNTPLSWKCRLEICIGAGRGLDYLHTGHGIIHRDIKSSNILLDANFVAKVSDFGLAKIHTGQSQASTNFKGTFGYMDPDYFQTRRLTMKSDTYSFGVMLLEVLCGRPAVDPSADEDKRSLTMWAQDKIRKGEVDDIVATSLRDEISPSSLKAFLKIVEWCLHHEPKRRPPIAHVIINLESALKQQVKLNSSVPKEIAGLADGLPFIDTIQRKNVSQGQTEHVPMAQQGDTKPYLPNEVENDVHAAGFTDILEWKKAKPFLTTQLTVGSTAGQMATSSDMKKATRPLNMLKTTIHKVARLWPSKRKRPIGSISAPLTLGTVRPRVLTTFSFAKLKTITRNFHSDTIIGEGGFGIVYKGLLKENGTRTAVAIKKLKSGSHQGFNEWQAEINLVGSLSHPNLVKLIGYCREDRELLIVYEFMSKGSLQECLFQKNVHPLPWDVRLQILLGAARGLSFLHSLQDQVIYRDFKASNILLDKLYQAKLSDFGLAKLGPAPGYSHVSTRVMGTQGYAAPEYLATGHLYVKSDVYCFGVVLLETITGLRALDMSRPYRQTNLVDWVKSGLHNRKKLIKFMDSRLDGKYPDKSAFELAQLAQNCLEPEPRERPSSQEIVEAIQRIQYSEHVQRR